MTVYYHVVNGVDEDDVNLDFHIIDEKTGEEDIWNYPKDFVADNYKKELRQRSSFLRFLIRMMKRPFFKITCSIAHFA